MRVQVLFFGMLKDVTGKSSAAFDVRDGATISDLLLDLEAIIPAIKKSLPSLAIAVNREYAGAETKLKPEDEIALLPPVSGGSR
jgi:molybdopterin converting factor subunit 1